MVSALRSNANTGNPTWEVGNCLPWGGGWGRWVGFSRFLHRSNTVRAVILKQIKS